MLLLMQICTVRISNSRYDIVNNYLYYGKYFLVFCSVGFSPYPCCKLCICIIIKMPGIKKKNLFGRASSSKLLQSISPNLPAKNNGIIFLTNSIFPRQWACAETSREQTARRLSMSICYGAR